MRVAAVVTLFTFALAACSSSTVIQTNVPGARVYLDGAYVGTTPYVMSDTKIVGSTTQVRIEAPGYQPVNAIITRSEDFSVGACIGGVLVLVPFLWIMGYNPSHTYLMEPATGAPGAPGAPAPGGWEQPPPGQ